MPESKSVLMIGTFDSKGEDYQFLYEYLIRLGHKVIAINTGTNEPKNINFKIDFTNYEVCEIAGESLESLRRENDRGKAVKVFGEGASIIAEKIFGEKKLSGAIGMGGSGGTYMVLKAFSKLPLGLPKVCLSTIATKDLSQQVGNKDVILIPSIVDIAGVNSISAMMMEKAADCLHGMLDNSREYRQTESRTIAVSIFGNTTPCTDECTRLLKGEEYEVLGFHANGSGGRTMESLIRDKVFNAVLDITTTELADNLCGGVCDAGADRLNAASELGIPQLVVPGCLDMVNFYHPETVPSKYADRKFYSWAPDVTLMRTNKEENEKLADRLVTKLQKSKGPVVIVLPLLGLSALDKMGNDFYDQDVNSHLFQKIKENSGRSIEVVEFEHHINDPEFAKKCTELLIKMVED